jgi:hypothetical protein
MVKNNGRAARRLQWVTCDSRISPCGSVDFYDEPDTAKQCLHTAKQILDTQAAMRVQTLLNLKLP